MANLTEYKKLIVDHVIDTLDNSNSGLGYQVTKFFGTNSPEALYNFIKGRINTANGTAFVRIGEVDYEAIDTLGKMYNCDFTVEIIVGSIQNIKEDQLPDTDRHTDKMIVDVRSELIDNPLMLQGRPQRFIALDDTPLFRTNEADAQLLKAQIQNINLEF